VVSLLIAVHNCAITYPFYYTCILKLEVTLFITVIYLHLSIIW